MANQNFGTFVAATTSAGTLDGTETVPVVVSGATKKTTPAALKTYIAALIAANNLSDLTNAGTARTNLGLGTAATQAATAFQAMDATLTAFAALTIAANSLTIGSGADAFSQTTFAANTFPARSSSGNLVAKAITDFGLSLVDDADASAARTTLGLGTAAVLAVGTSASQVVQLTAAAKLPAVDGSLLTNLPAGSAAGNTQELQFNNAGAFGGISYVKWDADAGLAVSDVSGQALLSIAPGFFSGTKQILVGTQGDHVVRIGGNAGTVVHLCGAADTLGLFGATPVAKQAANDALTDSSGGTASTTVESVDLTNLVTGAAEINDNFATMAAQLAKLRTLLVNYGLGA